MKSIETYIIVIIALFSLASQCSDKSVNSKFDFIKTDSTVLKFLGKPTIDFLNSADSIKVFVLNPLLNDSSKQNQLGFCVIKESQVLDSLQTVTFHRIVKNKMNYSFDNYVKNCTMLPNYLVAVYNTNKNKRDTLSILLDFNCDMWYFKFSKKIKSEDNEKARDSLLSWLSGIFPKKDSLIPKKDTMQIYTYGHLEEKFGLTISECILKSDSVVSYILDPEKTLKDSTKLFHGFLIVNKPLTLEKKYSTKLIEIISNKSNYKSSSIVKNCTFLPDIGFRFYKNKKVYSDLLIAFYCDEWCFSNSNQQYFKDSKLARQPLLELVRAIYPNVEYFKKLPEKNE